MLTIIQIPAPVTAQQQLKSALSESLGLICDSKRDVRRLFLNCLVILFVYLYRSLTCLSHARRVVHQIQKKKKALEGLVGDVSCL